MSSNETYLRHRKHRMEELSILTLMALPLFLAACSGSAGAVIPPPTDTGASSSVSRPPAESSSSLPSQPTAAVPRIINMTVESFKFTPDVLTLTRGENVTIHLTNVSGIHSFKSDNLGIDVPVPEGSSVDITIPTDRAGTFEFHCGIPCGDGHRDMVGQISIR